jgi:transposase
MSRHSNDLRSRVISVFKSGKSKSMTAKTFQISRDTLDSWIKLDKDSKLLEIKQYRRGKLPKVDLDKFKEYVDKNSDKYYTEIAKEFKISKSQAHRYVTQKLGYTSKKTNLLQRIR